MPEKTALLVTLEYPPQHGGVGTYLANLVEGFPARSIQVLAPDHQCAHELDMDSPAVIYRRRLSWRLWPRWLPALYWTWRICRLERPSAIIVSHVLPMGSAAMFIGALLRLPYIVVVHGMDIALAGSSGPWKRLMARQILKRASLVVANSEYTATWTRSFGVEEQRTMIVPPGPNSAFTGWVSDRERVAVRKAHARDHEFLLMTAGRLVGRKGFDICLDAVHKLVERGRDVKLVIVGEGPERQRLEEQARRLGIDARVLFTGAVPVETLQALYAAADAFVMVPRSIGPDIEGFGIVYLEANMMGTPVIGSRSGGVPEAVRHEETGLLVDPDDTAMLMDAIVRLMDDREFGAKLAANGRRRVTLEYGGGRQTKRFAAALNRVMD